MVFYTASPGGSTIWPWRQKERGEEAEQQSFGTGNPAVQQLGQCLAEDKCRKQQGCATKAPFSRKVFV
ncbi:MAG: hypothetical protein DRQ02_08120 [Candidatus Latescibacterota bacterium]|nr:MAG: hypothetical protein DRQ02_08120 [Candidatus Latescibacterota bacterium]RKY70363.1 MAG: hypothetical protein DRQ24_09410 [Candidatus Latescibacterota bacterium]